MLLVVAACVLFACFAPVAFADETSAGNDAAESEAAESPDYSKYSLEELKTLVNEKTEKRDEVDARKNEVEDNLLLVKTQLQAVEAQLPIAQMRADDAVVERYKIQRHGATLIDALMAVPDFTTFVDKTAYIERIVEVDLDDLRKLRLEEKGFKLKQGVLESELASTKENLERITADLEEATKARDEAQRKADLVANAHLAPDGADWGAGEEKFIEVWAPRIDAYLEGSPLAGQGKTFAQAAWANHVDPRWSPAISNTESSKGRNCIRPHNAWGWGAADSNPYGLASEWGSWEEAINAHVSGLARGYGYTISEAGAQSYCPGSWEEWYANTVAQMNSI